MERKPIYYDYEKLEILKQRYPTCADWLQVEMDKLRKYYDELPFQSDKKVRSIQKLKETLTFYNPNYLEEQNIKKEEEKKKKEEKEVQKLKEKEEKKFKENKIYDTNKSIREQYIDLLKDKKWGDASELLAKWVERVLNLYTTKEDQKSEMWMYKEGIYVPQGKSGIKELLRRCLGKWYSIWMFNQVLAKVEADTYIDTDEFFKNINKEEIPVENGILNIRTRELSEFTPKKIFFNKLPVKYDVYALCPQIEQFLKDVLADETDRHIFYQMGGFCLLKEYKFEKAFMLVGNGRNGKDKSLELIKRTLGLDNCCSVPLSLIVPDSFIISEFFGKMVNIAGEIDNKDLKDTSAFKSLTGRSLLSAPRKFLKPITFVNYAKFIFACNDLPMVYDTSKGFWDRWILLEYPYTFVTKEELEKAEDKTYLKLRDEDIIEKISAPDELSGLLNKFLDGLDNLLESKTFCATKGSEEIKNLWIRKSNSFMAFALDCLEADYDCKVRKKDLRQKYSKYCKDNKVNGKSDLVIKIVLQELFGVVEERIEVMGSHDWYWIGVKLKDESKKL